MDDPAYALDELGWLQFERLCRLVVAEAFEASPPGWIGPPGRGQVAVVDDSIALPGRSRLLPGPVSIVIAWAPPAENAWDRATEFVERVTEPAETVGLGRSTLVLTNLARVVARDALRLAGFAEGRRIGVLGSEDFGRLLDEHPGVRCAMPSLLGLRDLGPLIPTALAESSVFDLEGATALARVFWPTEAYGRARVVLARHRFVVLTGPPEMGKTAIARMLALALMTDGWEARECTRPEEVFAALHPGRRQVFIADDAFGSTEYLADAGERWAQAMSRLLPRLDDRHWLIWTSRPAPLKAGLRRLQRERGAEQFPSPGEVTVDASDLTLAEKTLILFRHAKASAVLDAVRQPVQSAGIEIVEHRHFTPERIRRLVALLPEDGRSRSADPDAIKRMLDLLIGTPTDAMRNSYRALADEHRQLLVAVLDAPAGMIDERELAATLRRHRPGGLSQPPGELIDRLTDHFLRITSLGIGWVHPSWRDLVIDELRGDAGARDRFLRTCGIDGVLLAISVEGGIAGERYLPLLLTDGDWDAIADRCTELICELEDRQLARLLLGVAQARLLPVISTAGRAELEHLATTILTSAARAVDTSNRLLTAPLVEAWYALCSGLGSSEQLPVARTWLELRPNTSSDPLDVAELARIDEWLAIAEVLQRHDLTQLSELNFDADRKLLDWIQVLVARGDVATEQELVDDVMARTARLCPELSAAAAAAVRARDTRRATAGDLRWWTPEDIAEPPSHELAAESREFERGDVRRVLKDL